MQRLVRRFATLPTIAVFLVICSQPIAAQQDDGPQPMNIVFILADDLGWSDTTLYGTTELYDTPNLERLAERGMTFTHAYANSPLCSPTRASVLTGQTPARHGSTAPQHHTNAVRLRPEHARTPAHIPATNLASVSRLDTLYPTLSSLLFEAGYRTAHLGKWHLGIEPYSPLEHGFEVDIPHWHGPGPAGGFVAPWRYPDFESNHPDEHIEDRMAEEAVNWLASLDEGEQFFLNYWQFSVHAPFDARADYIEHYRTQVDPDSPQRSAIYAAMVRSLDDAVGTLLDTLDEQGLADNTIIVFISDNGGNMYDLPEGIPPTSNAPLRGGKATLWEGGVRVPCVVVWPGVTEPGSVSDQVIQTSDFYPTLLNGVGVSWPISHAVDGIDIMPALRGGELEREAIFTYFPHTTPRVPDWLPPAVSVHAGDWKLIRVFFAGEDGGHAYHLFNLAEDLGETTNLADQHPDIVAALDAMIDAHLRQTRALVPVPNPAFDPERFDPEQIGVPVR